MNTRRLNILADFLDSIPPRYPFNLVTWGTHKPKNTGDRSAPRAEKLLLSEALTKDEAEVLFVDCGYVACAIGHACMSHKLRAEGLDYILNGLTMTPTFDGVEDWEAVHEFFDIDEDLATHFFAESAYGFSNTTAKNVATRIREYLLK